MSRGIHRLGAVATCVFRSFLLYYNPDWMSRTANPAYTADELVYQIKLTKASILFTFSANLSTSEQAARSTGIPMERIIILDSPVGYSGPYVTLNTLIREGLSKHPTFVERRLNPGEAKTKIALLNFSSGTTGRPKAVAIPHYAVIANVIQIAFYTKVNDEAIPKEKRRYGPGQVTIAGASAMPLMIMM